MVHSSAVFTSLLSYPSLSSFGVSQLASGIWQWSYESWRRSDETTIPWDRQENNEIRGDFASTGLLDRCLSARRIQALKGNWLDACLIHVRMMCCKESSPTSQMRPRCKVDACVMWVMWVMLYVVVRSRATVCCCAKSEVCTLGT